MNRLIAYLTTGICAIPVFGLISAFTSLGLLYSLLAYILCASTFGEALYRLRLQLASKDEDI